MISQKYHLMLELCYTNPWIMLLCSHVLHQVWVIPTIHLDRDIILTMITSMMGQLLITHIVDRMSSTMMHLECREVGVEGNSHHPVTETGCPVLMAAIVIIGYLVMNFRILMALTTMFTTKLIIIR